MDFKYYLSYLQLIKNETGILWEGRPEISSTNPQYSTECRKKNERNDSNQPRGNSYLSLRTHPCVSSSSSSSILFSFCDEKKEIISSCCCMSVWWRKKMFYGFPYDNNKNLTLVVRRRRREGMTTWRWKGGKRTRQVKKYLISHKYSCTFFDASKIHARNVTSRITFSPATK